MPLVPPLVLVVGLLVVAGWMALDELAFVIELARALSFGVAL